MEPLEWNFDQDAYPIDLTCINNLEDQLNTAILTAYPQASNITSSSSREQKRRRRIARACDQCNAVRTKCDGEAPCTHCQDRDLRCTYERRLRRRGKPVKKRSDVRNLRNRVSEDGAPPTNETIDITGETSHSQHEFGLDFGSEAMHFSYGDNHLRGEINCNLSSSPQRQGASEDLRSPFRTDEDGIDFMLNQSVLPEPRAKARGKVSARRAGFPGLQEGSVVSNGRRQGLRSGSQIHSSPGYQSSQLSSNQDQPVDNASGSPPIKYPVLHPILPHLGPICSPKMACDLLHGYFATASDNILLPSSPFIIDHIFIRHSFLSRRRPRRYSPAMLASMLWLSAQTTECHFFGNSPSLRSQLTQELFDLIISLLNVPRTSSLDGDNAAGSNPEKSDARARAGVDGIEPHPYVQSGVKQTVTTLDDVITYMHLGIVISARESNPAGFHWWHIAFQLAKELKLNREMPETPGEPDIAQHTDEEATGSAFGTRRYTRETEGSQASDELHRLTCSPASVWGNAEIWSGEFQELCVAQEQREERRRVWWTLFILDRHLALCYKSPLALKDIECQDLQQPMNELTWQLGVDIPEGDRGNRVLGPTDLASRRYGPPIRCLSFGMFELFLPVASILGQIVDFHQAKSHPRLGPIVSSETVSSNYIGEIGKQLQSFEQSLSELEAFENAENSNAAASETQLPESVSQSCKNQTRFIVTYGRLWLNVLHVLLHSRWDITLMLSSTSSSWTSTPSFVAAMQYSISAAKCLDTTLKVDYDLSFSPYFIGIYLLQGALIPLVAIMEWREKSSAEVLAACEHLSERMRFVL